MWKRYNKNWSCFIQWWNKSNYIFKWLAKNELSAYPAWVVNCINY
ncbi:hypothetical protein [Fusobacterium varium]